MEFLNPITRFVPVLLERLKDEYNAHMLYSNIANHLNVMGYTKAAKYFEGEATDELLHAKDIQNFLVNWNVSFTMPQPETDYSFVGLRDCIEKAYEIESKLYIAYNSNATASMSADISLFRLLSDKVQKQYESVAEYRTFIDKMSLYNDDKTGMKLFENEVF